mgnify:CR=1 FL=1
MLNIEGKQFTINLDNLFNYIIRPSKQDKREQEITDGYDLSSGDGMKQVSKIIREVKSKGDTNQESCRYDFLRILLSQVLDIETSFSSPKNKCVFTAYILSEYAKAVIILICLSGYLSSKFLGL